MAAAVIEHEDTFMVIGGSTVDDDGIQVGSDKIYKYSKDDGGQWVEVPSTLSETKYHIAAIKVKSSFSKSC